MADVHAEYGSWKGEGDGDRDRGGGFDCGVDNEAVVHCGVETEFFDAPHCGAVDSHHVGCGLGPPPVFQCIGCDVGLDSFKSYPEDLWDRARVGFDAGWWSPICFYPNGICLGNMMWLTGGDSLKDAVQ